MSYLYARITHDEVEVDCGTHASCNKEVVYAVRPPARVKHVIPGLSIESRGKRLSVNVALPTSLWGSVILIRLVSCRKHRWIMTWFGLHSTRTVRRIRGFLDATYIRERALCHTACACFELLLLFLTPSCLHTLSKPTLFFFPYYSPS